MDKREKVTVCFKSMLGITVMDATLVDHGTRPYAQYASVPFVRFVPKGKRNVRQYLEGYKPYVIVLRGHLSAMLDESPWTPKRTESVGTLGTVEVQESRYSSCDPRWATDFDAKIARLDPSLILVDYRTKE